MGAGRIAGFIFTVVIPVVVAATIPHIGLSVGLPIILVSVVIGLCDFVWMYSKQRYGRVKVIPIIAMAVGVLLLGGGAIAFFVGPTNKTTAEVPNISFQKMAFFWVETDKNVYQIGVIAKLFNLDQRPYLINGMAFEWLGEPTITGRGSATIQRWTQWDDRAEIMEDNYIKGGNEGYYKKLLPIRFEMTIAGGPPPGFMLNGQWNLFFGKQKIETRPEFQGTYEGVVSRAQWDDLLKPKSTVDVENIHFDKTAPVTP